MKLQSPRIAFATAAAAAAIALTLSGCSPQAATSKSVNSGSGTYTAAEVKEASGGRVDHPLFAVPKSHDKWTFAFIDPGLTIPTFVEWKNGVTAAAKFYGVNVLQADQALDQTKALTAYQTLSLKNPTVVGGGAGQLPVNVIKQAKTDGAKVVLIDQQPTAQASFDWFGVNDAAVGKAGAEQLAIAAKKLQSTTWSGKKIAYLGVSVAGCGPCDARVKAGGTIVKDALGLSGSDVLFLSPSDGSAAGEQAAATDFLTAHPDSKIVSLAYGDGGAVGVLNALAQSNRVDDGLAVSLGGDPSGRAALRDPKFSKAFVGAVDFNPWAEGWNWVEASIAAQTGKKFGTYSTERFLTPANVDSFYPDDKK